jgi:uncharacterized membrane protein
MLTSIVVLAATALACTFVLATTWLRAAEMQAGRQNGFEEPRASATASLMIECAALKERVRKLERIADGLEA